MDNRANRIAKTIRAKVRRAQTKRHTKQKRDDLRREILEKVMDAELEFVTE